MADAKTRPISFRVSEDVLDTIESEGKSATEIARAALEREARLVKVRAAWKHMKANPLPLSFEGDIVEAIRRDRDSH